MNFLMSFALLVFGIVSSNVAVAAEPNIGDVYSQGLRDVVNLISAQGLKVFYCDFASNDGTIPPRTIFAKTQAEAYQICLNSEPLSVFTHSDGSQTLNLRISDIESVRINGVAVRRVRSH